jgi:hypothetical protein
MDVQIGAAIHGESGAENSMNEGEDPNDRIPSSSGVIHNDTENQIEEENLLHSEMPDIDEAVIEELQQDGGLGRAHTQQTP